MKTSHLLAITFLLGTSYMYAMELEEIPDESELRTPQIIAEWRIQGSAPVGALAYSPDGEEIAIGCDKKVLLVRPMDSILPTRGSDTKRNVHALAYSPDGEQIAIGCSSAITLASFYNEVIIASKDLECIGGWPSELSVDMLTYLNNGEHIAVGHNAPAAGARLEGTVQIRSITDGTVIKEEKLKQPVSAIALGCNAKTIATARSNRVRILSPDNTVITEWVTHGPVCSLAANPNGQFVATGHCSGKVQIRNILPVLAAHACKRKKLTLRQWLLLKELHHNTTNKPLYLNADRRGTFDSLRGTENGAEREPGIDNFYALQEGNSNDSETHETKKTWCIVPKTFDRNKLEEHDGKNEDPTVVPIVIQ